MTPGTRLTQMSRAKQDLSLTNSLPCAQEKKRYPRYGRGCCHCILSYRELVSGSPSQLLMDTEATHQSTARVNVWNARIQPSTALATAAVSRRGNWDIAGGRQRRETEEREGHPCTVQIAVRFSPRTSRPGAYDSRRCLARSPGSSQGRLACSSCTTTWAPGGEWIRAA